MLFSWFETLLANSILRDGGSNVVALHISQLPLQRELRPAGGVRIRQNPGNLFRRQRELDGNVRIGRQQELQSHFLQDWRISWAKVKQR